MVSMLVPDLKDFLRLAEHATLVPVAKTVAADLRTPVSAFLSIAADEPYAFLLESVEGGEKIGRYTFLGARPYAIVAARGNEVEVQYPNKQSARRAPPPEVLEKARERGGVFGVLREVLRQQRPAHVEGLPPFSAG